MRKASPPFLIGVCRKFAGVVATRKKIGGGTRPIHPFPPNSQIFFLKNLVEGPPTKHWHLQCGRWVFGPLDPPPTLWGWGGAVGQSNTVNIFSRTHFGWVLAVGIV